MTPAIDPRELLRNYLDSKEFYNLGQRYRMAPIANQKEVMDAWEELKRGILRAVTPPTDKAEAAGRS